MIKKEQNRKGGGVNYTTFVGLEGEITIDTDKETAVVHDKNGIKKLCILNNVGLAKQDLSNINSDSKYSVELADASEVKYGLILSFYDKRITVSPDVCRDSGDICDIKLEEAKSIESSDLKSNTNYFVYLNKVEKQKGSRRIGIFQTDSKGKPITYVSKQQSDGSVINIYESPIHDIETNVVGRFKDKIDLMNKIKELYTDKNEVK